MNNQNGLPVNWELKRLDELAEIVAGVPAPKVTFESGDYPFVRMKELGESHLSISFLPDSEYVTKAQNLPITKAETILIPRSGSVHLNHRAILKQDAVIVSHICGLIANEDIDTNFLYYQLCQFDMTHIMTQTTGLNAISFSELRKVSFKVPINKSEQTRIAAVLSCIDHAIEQTEALIAKQQRIKTGLMQDLLTKGIDEHGNIRSEATHEFKDSTLGRIPKEWNALPLNRIADLQVGYAFKSSWFSDDGVRLLRGENVGFGKPIWTDMRCLPASIAQHFQEYFLTEGDLVIGMDRTFTKSGVKISRLEGNDAPSLLVQRVGRFIPLYCDASFLAFLVSQDEYHLALLNQQKGMDIPHLSKTDILSPLVRVAPTKEQTRIAIRLSLLDSFVQSEQRRLAKLISSKKGLMSDLLTGKVSANEMFNNVGSCE